MSSEQMTPVSTNSQAEGDGEQLSTPNSPFSDRKNAGKADPKVCGVCGDKALGNNFNAITCESCKAFFRRNALRTKEFVCPFSNKCKVDAITRRFCQRCRLKKCFDIGMKKEWIMTDEEKKIKKQKIEQNRLKRSSFENSGSGFPEEEEEDSSPPAAKLRKGGPAHVGSLVRDDIQVANPKQPMMEHNHNSNLKWSGSGGLKTRNNNNSNNEVIAIQVASSPFPQEGLAPEVTASPHESAKETEELSSPDTNPPVEPHSATLSWTENSDGDSSSSSSTHPPPLVHHHPKKQLPTGLLSEITDPNIVGDSTSDMPLLSSLIRRVQSPSDQAVSPVAAPPIIPAAESDETEAASGMTYQENELNSVSPSTVSISHVTHEPNTSNQYFERESFLSSPSTEESHQSRLALYEEYMRKCLRGAERGNGCQVEDAELIPLPLNTMDSILSVAIAAEFNAFGMLGSNNNSKELNKAEQGKLNELLLASQALHAPVDAERPVNVSETSDPSLINVINLTEIAIRRLIKMSKKISGFKNMCQEDQIALLKGGCTEMMVIRSVTTYDPDRDSWQIPHSNPGYKINLGVLKEARGNLYEEHQRFVKSFRSEWRSNENIMIILCAITLFTPERLNVVHKDVVKLEQDSYYYLLKRYLESIMNGCEAKSTYLQLIRKVAELRKLNSSHVRVFLEMNPKEVEPLLIEIFDLK